MHKVNRTIGLIVALSVLSCDTSRSLFRQPLTPVATNSVATRFLEPRDDCVEIKVLEVNRGERGATFIFRVQNQLVGHTLLFRPSDISIRLGSGLYRNSMSEADAKTMCDRYGQSAYGCDWLQFYVDNETDNIRALCILHLGKALIKPAAVTEWHAIESGQWLTVAITFGTVAEESSVQFGFQPALRIRDPQFDAPRELAKPVNLIAKLPRILPESKWPSWLQLGFSLSSDDL